MTLTERLAAAPDDKTADQILAAAWRDFAGSDAADALAAEIRSIRTHYARSVLSANIAPETRAFAAGAVAALALLRARVEMAQRFNPDEHEYTIAVLAADALDTDEIFDPSTN